MKSRTWMCSLLFLPLALSSAPALCTASSQPDGYPVCTAPRDQLNPAMATDGAGGCYIVWQDQRAGLQFDIYVQHITPVGTLAPGWPVDGSPVCTAAGDQIDPQVVPDGSGGAIVTWSDARDGTAHIYAQRISGFGAIASGWPTDGIPVCLADLGQATPSAAPDGTGGAIIVWADGRNENWDIAAQHVLGTGIVDPTWPVNGAPLCLAHGAQQHPQALSDGNGGAFVLWDDQRFVFPKWSYATDHDLYLQRIMSDGTAAPGWTPDGIALSPIVGLKDWAHLIPDGAGGVIAGWVDSAFGMVAKRIGADGVTAAGWPEQGRVLCAAGQIYVSAIATDGQGGAIATWEMDRAYPVRNVRARQVSAAGSPFGDNCGSMVNLASGFGDEPRMVPDGVGGAYVIWVDYGAGHNISGAHITATGTPAPGSPAGGVPVSRAPGYEITPVMIPDGFGGALCAWTDYRHSHTSVSNADIYAQVLVPGDATATQISLLSADAREGLVRLTWYSGAGAGLTVTVYRSTLIGEWNPLGRALSDGTGRISYEDAQVSAGSRYGYRVGVQETGGERFYGETWVDVPAAADPALLSASPNPSRGALTVTFSLRGAESARLEVLDAAGRSVESREVGSLGAGLHIIRLGEATRLPPGLYLLRLTQGEHSSSTHGVIVR